MIPAIYAKKLYNKIGWAAFWLVLTYSFINFIFAHQGMWVFAVIACLLFIKQLRLAIRLASHGFYQGKLQRKAKNASDEYGSASWSTLKDAQKASMTNVNKGFIFGWIADQILTSTAIFSMLIWPTGEGKTSRFSLINILHGFRREIGKGKSRTAHLCVFDPKIELAPMASRATNINHKSRNVYLNPNLAGGFGNTSINFLTIIIDDCNQSERNKFAVMNATEFCLVLINEPDGADDKNFYFRQGAREIIIVVILYLACETQNKCYMAEVARIVLNKQVLDLTLKKAAMSEALEGDLADMAISVLEAEDTQFAQFHKNAKQPLMPFVKSGILGKATTKDEFRFDELFDPENEEHITVWVMNELANKEAFGKWTELVLFCMVKAALRSGQDGNVHVLIEEASSTNIRYLLENITTLRSSGLTATFIVQTTAELERRIGKLLTKVLLSQCGFKSYAGTNDPDEAKDISASIGEHTSKSYSHNQQSSQSNSDLTESVSEHGKPLYSTQDVMHMPEDEQIVLVGRNKPFKCKKLSYAQVSQFYKLLDDNPIEGGKLPFDPKFEISYKEVSQ